MGIRSSLVVAIACAVVLAPAPATWAAVPYGVSPGGVDRVTTTEDRSPTFSWGAVAGATDYELVVLALPEGLPISEVDLAEAEEVLFTTVPVSATSWTPSAEQSLNRGGRYVWFVRGVTIAGEGEVLDATGWSPGRYFTVATAPSVDEVEQAVAVLLDYIDSGGDRSADPSLRALLEDNQAVRRGVSAAETDAKARKRTRSVLTAVAAIRGEQPDPTGETYGVVGTSASAAGAGLGAANTAGGADLVLDGSADGTADTVLRESGIYRDSEFVESFTIANSILGPGGIALQVEGSAAIHGAPEGDLLTLTYADDTAPHNAMVVTGGGKNEHRVVWMNAENTAGAFLDHTRVGILTGGGVGDHLHTHTHGALADDEPDKHRLINDAGTGAAELWSAAKVSAEIAALQAQLDSHNHDSRYVRQSEGSLRVIRGWVWADGTVEVGSGFTVSHPRTGTYEIQFNPQITSWGTPVISPMDVDPPVFVRWNSIGNGFFSFDLRDSNSPSTRVDQDWSFVAYGR